MSLSRFQSITVALIGTGLVAASAFQINDASETPPDLRAVSGTVTSYKVFLQPPRSADSIRVTVTYDWNGEPRSYTGFATFNAKTGGNPYPIGSTVQLYAFVPHGASEPRIFLQPPADRRGSWLVVGIFGGLLIVGAYALRARPRI